MPRAKPKPKPEPEAVPVKPKMGRPRAEIPWNIFEGLCEIQATEEEIAGVLRISVDTLGRHCKEHYGETFAEISKKYSAVGKASLRRHQFNLAKTNAACAIWLGKQYLGQRDQVDVNMNVNETRQKLAAMLGVPESELPEKPDWTN